MSKATIKSVKCTSESTGRKSVGKLSEVLCYFPSFMASLCCIAVFIGYTGLNVYFPLVVSIAAATGVLLISSAVWNFMGKYSLIAIIGFLLLWIKNFDLLLKGLYFYINAVSKAMGFDPLMYVEDISEHCGYVSVNFVIWGFTVFVCMLGYISNTLFVGKCLFFIFSFAMVGFGMYNDLVPNKLYFAVVVFYWFFMLIKENCENKSSLSDYAKTHINILVYTLVCSVCVCAVTAVFFANIPRPKAVDDKRKEIFFLVNNYSFEEIYHKIFEPEDKVNPLETGVANPQKTAKEKLGDKGSIEFTHTPVLDVTIQNPEEMKSDIYFKAYSEGDYAESSWSNDGKDAERVDRIFSQMAYPDIYSIGYELAIGYKNIGEQVYKTKITVEETGADKSLAYIPYYSKTDEKTSNVADLYQNIEKNTYTFDYCDFVALDKYFNDIFGGNTVSKELLGNFMEYSDYAKEHYLKADSQIVKDISQGIPNYANGIKEEIDFIKNFFDLNYTYSLNPEKTPEGEDFVDYFLKSQRKGYCEYFASAGTLICRSLGIPSRYVSGYVLHIEDIKDGIRNEDGSVTVTVVSDNAHAWTEIYSPATGWIPVDFTPASYFQSGGQESYGQNNESSENSSGSSEKDSSSENSDSSDNLQSSVYESSRDESKINSGGSESLNSSDSSDNEDSPKATGNSTAAVSSGSGNLNSADRQKAKKIAAKAITAILVCFAAAAFVLLRKKLINLKVRKAFESDDKNFIAFAYARYLRLLRLLESSESVGKEEYSTDCETADRLKNSLEKAGFGQLGEDLTYLNRLAVSVRFGNKAVSESQRREVKAIFERLEFTISENKSPLERFRLRFVSCVIR